MAEKSGQRVDMIEERGLVGGAGVNCWTKGSGLGHVI